MQIKLSTFGERLNKLQMAEKELAWIEEELKEKQRMKKLRESRIQKLRCSLLDSTSVRGGQMDVGDFSLRVSNYDVFEVVDQDTLKESIKKSVYVDELLETTTTLKKAVLNKLMVADPDLTFPGVEKVHKRTITISKKTEQSTFTGAEFK